MTTIYLMRHSEPFKIHRGIEDISDSFQLYNVKTPLSVNGEHLAEKLSKESYFSNIDIVWSSDYVRAMSTAKYFAYNHDLKVNVSNKLGERIYGISSWEELPADFESKQFLDDDYKMPDGESKKEVRARMLSAINYLLDNYSDKTILVVGHSTALAFLLNEWCEINYKDNYYFNGQVLFDGNWNYCETFKLEFNNHDLISIKNIKY